jgi:hypothetical protein
MQDMQSQMFDPEPSTSQAQHPRVGPPTSSRTSTNHNSSKRARQQPILKYCPAPILNEEKIEFHSLLLEFQAEANLPDSFVSRQSFQRLIKFCNVEAVKALPIRQLLGGPILNKYADKVDLGDHATLKASPPLGSGKHVNFLSDAWENIAKTHILGVILSFASLCVTFGTFTCGSRHDGLAIAEHLESILLLMIAQGWDVGAIVTDNAGNCARARRILALRWPKIVFLFCYAHQINLLVKDVIATSWKITVSQAHAIVSTLNKSTAKWLLRLRDVMKATYGNTVTLALVQMADTRWNSVQGMLASLLRVRSTCKMFVLRWSSHANFPNDLYALGSDTFWKECEDTKALIKPLTIAFFRLQRD